MFVPPNNQPMPPQGGMPPRPATPPQGGAPMPGPAGAPPGGPPGGQQISPEQRALMQHLQPNNQIQALLLKRIDGLTPQDVQAFQQNIKPPAIEVLKKLFPEIAFIFDMAMQQGGAPGGAPGAPGAATIATTTGPAAEAEMRRMEAQAAPPRPPQPGPAMARPQTQLGRF